MWLTVSGLSPPVGAFLAGMVIGETDFRHQIEDDIRPLGDLLVGVFFVTVGMATDPRTLVSAPLSVLAWLALLLAKSVLVAAIVRISGWPATTAARTAVCLGQGGEFGLLMLTLAVEAEIVRGMSASPASSGSHCRWGCRPFSSDRTKQSVVWLSGASISLLSLRMRTRCVVWQSTSRTM